MNPDIEHDTRTIKIEMYTREPTGLIVETPTGHRRPFYNIRNLYEYIGVQLQHYMPGRYSTDPKVVEPQALKPFFIPGWDTPNPVTNPTTQTGD